MHKTIQTLIVALFSIAVCPITALAKGEPEYATVHIQNAPFDMPDIHTYVFPSRVFPITRYGAKSDGQTLCTKAINQAIRACHKAGGGHVVVPPGDWITGAIHLMSNVDLHLEEGSRLIFTDHPEDYLPAVFTTWEGIECYNYSPLIYAYECENIKISGTGTLAPRMEFWRTWFDRPAPHIAATAELYRWGAESVPVEQRRLTDLPESNMRPHLIQFNRCKRVVLEDFKIKESPFWTIHMFQCDEGLVRGLDVYAHGHNNDGIDLEMSSRFLVEGCSFDQGDDAIVIKAGRNQDAWRLQCPSRNIVVRNCTVRDGHVLLGIGSEMSGGVENVWLHDCTVNGELNAIFYVKTNHRRGGFVRNIWLENAHVSNSRRVFAIDTDVVYQWKDFPDYETRYTDIEGLHMHAVVCDSARIGIDINGEPNRPVRNVELKDIDIRTITQYPYKAENVEGLSPL